MNTAPASKPGSTTSQNNDELPESWFGVTTSPTGIRVSTLPPRASRTSSLPPVQTVGEFLGDELADAWLR